MVQLERLEQLYSHSQAQSLDGIRQPALEFWDTLQARAALKAGSAAGADGNTTDIYKELPFLAVSRIHRLFSERSTLPRDSPSSPFWKTSQFVGLPKTHAVTTFGDFRWICKSAVVQKWFLRTLRPRLRMQMKPSSVHSYGFRRSLLQRRSLV